MIFDKVVVGEFGLSIIAAPPDGSTTKDQVPIPTAGGMAAIVAVNEHATG